MMKFIWIGLAGVVGANLRYGISVWTEGILLFHALPVGTFIANLLGAFCIGLFSTYFMTASGRTAFVAVRTGLIGSFTTFSALSLEVVMLVESEYILLASLYAIGSLFLSIAFVLGGISLAHILGKEAV